MSKIPLCLNNSVAGYLHEVPKKNSLVYHFTYDPDYLASPDALPLTLAMSLEPRTFDEKIVMPFLQAYFGQEIIRPGLFSSKGNIHLGSSLSLASYGMLPLSLEALTFQEEEGNQLKRHVLLANEEFYDPQKPLLSTHILKRDKDPQENRISNEIFITLLAYNFGLPVSKISRFSLGEGYVLIADRPDRQVIEGATLLPHFNPGESLSTALFSISQSPLVKGRPKGKENVKVNPHLPEEIAQLMRQFSLRPALDLRLFLRLIFLCYVAGCEEYTLQNIFVAYCKGGIRLAQCRDLLCTSIYSSHVTSTPLFLEEFFGVSRYEGLTEQHLLLLAKKMNINGRFLFEIFQEDAKIILKLSEEVFHDYPTLQGEITKEILNLITLRAQHLLSL